MGGTTLLTEQGPQIASAHVWFVVMISLQCDKVPARQYRWNSMMSKQTYVGNPCAHRAKQEFVGCNNIKAVWSDETVEVAEVAVWSIL